MATGSLGKGEVKAICDELECSPSQESSKSYGKHVQNPSSAKISAGKSATEGKESALGKTGRKKAIKGASY